MINNLIKFKKNFVKIRFFQKRSVLAVISIIFTLLITYSGLFFYFRDRVYPGVKVLGFNVGTKNTNEVSKHLSQEISVPEKIILSSNEKVFDLPLEEISLSYDFDKTAKNAYEIYRKGPFLTKIANVITSPFITHQVTLTYNVDYEKLDKFMQRISEEVISEPIYPFVEVKNGTIVVERGSPGETLDKDLFLKQLNKKISEADFSQIILPLIEADPSLNDEEAKKFEEKSKKYLGKTLYLTNEYNTYIFDETDIFVFLDYHKIFNTDTVRETLKNEIISNVERPPQNAILRFENGKVVEFSPAKDGLTVELDILIEKVIEGLLYLENSEAKSKSIEIPVFRKEPEISLDKVNNFGIRELIGRGTSKFRGSIAGRVHNISLASSKFNGILIPPGETFSFNETLGDVSTLTGYEQAYIIKDGKTVLGDGGGVCQVSTTLFRAVLDAGLPINERRAHSYRVGYYEQDSSPGLDATVFSPTTDFKFTNDTSEHLLIQTEFDAKNFTLVFEIYGTSDGRVSNISKPVITSSVAPPEDLYVDDPSLPEGTIKQIEYKSWGAKVVFNYSVERNGEKIIEKTFVSNYQPWQAVYLRGIAPI